MSHPFDRSFIAQAAIIGAACFGALAIVIRPQEAEIARLESEIESHDADQAAKQHQSLPELAARLAAFHDRVSEIAARQATASDTSKLYGMLTELAGRHGVHVQNMQPGTSQQNGGKDEFRISRVEVAVDGPYENVAAFLDSVTTLPVFIRAESLQLTPTLLGGKRSVTARAGFDILRFEIPATLAGLGDANRAEP